MKHIILILLCLFLCTSCISCGSPTSTDKQGLTITNNKVYPGGVIKAKIVSGENIKQISVGMNGLLTINSKKPEGNKWEGEADIPALNPGKYEIAFVVTPFNAPSTTLTSEIEVVNKPAFDVQTSSVDGKKKITVKGDGISSVELLGSDPIDSSRVSFTKNNNTFEYQGTPQPNIKLVITDVNGLTQEKPLSLEIQDVIFFSKGSYLTSQTEDQTKSFLEERLTPFEQEDELMKSYVSNSRQKRLKPLSGIDILGISPNKRFLLLISKYGLDMGKPVIDSGRKLRSIALKYYYIYDRQTKTNHLIDKLYRKNYSPIPKERFLNKEIGSYYYPVFWGEDELLVIKVKKGENLIAGSEIDKYPQLITANQSDLTQSLDATPTCMSISLNDFTMKESTKVKPITPWVCWADQYQGIISWMSPTESSTSQLSSLPTPENGSQYPNLVSDLSGAHVWNIPAQAKTILSKDEKFEDALLISATYWNGKKAILISVDSDKKSRVCVMDIETGSIDVLLDNVRDLRFDFSFTFGMLYGTPSNPNKEPIALLHVQPIPIDPYDVHSPYKKDVIGIYVAQITKGDIKLLWNVDPSKYPTGGLNPYFITEVVK